MIFNEKIETASKEELKEIQSLNLSNMVKYIYNNSPFYQKRMDELGIKPSDIKDISDISKLPFTTKEDLRDNYPYGVFSNHKDLAEIHISSGTTGNPTLVGYTQKDLDLWGEVMARSFAAAGAKPGDMLQNTYGYGLFTGGLGAHYGGLKLGMTVLPVSSGNTARQIKLMQDFKPRILSCTPSYSLYIAEFAAKAGLDLHKSSWEVGVFGAEPWTERMRKQIEAKWNMRATDIYGLSEVIGPGVAQECEFKDGLHVWSDVFFPEVIDPKTGEPVPEGQNGELVFTTFTKEAIPLIRYRTKDIVSINYETCKCGRTAPRISKVKGRTDDMIVVKGINIFPSQVEHVLLSIKEVSPHYQILIDRSESNQDSIEVLVEINENSFSDEIKEMNALEKLIIHELHSVLSITAKVKLMSPMSIERSEGKAKRVIDRRNI